MPDVAPHPSIVNPETETAMTTTALKRISTSVLLADEDALYGLRTIEGYKPPNEDYTLEAIEAAFKEYKAAQEAESRIEKALEAARDTTIRYQHKFHGSVVGARQQVVAIYGGESDEVVAVGLKKKSDRKPARRSTPTTPAA